MLYDNLKDQIIGNKENNYDIFTLDGHYPARHIYYKNHRNPMTGIARLQNVNMTKITLHLYFDNIILEARAHELQNTCFKTQELLITTF